VAELVYEAKAKENKLVEGNHQTHALVEAWDEDENEENNAKLKLSRCRA